MPEIKSPDSKKMKIENTEYSRSPAVAAMLAKRPNPAAVQRCMDADRPRKKHKVVMGGDEMMEVDGNDSDEDSQIDADIMAMMDDIEATSLSVPIPAKANEFPVKRTYKMSVCMDALNYLRMNEDMLIEAFPNAYEGEKAAQQVRQLHKATIDGILCKTYVRKSEWSQLESKGISLSNCKKELRSKLAVDYVDVDIVNAGPSYMLDRAIELGIAAPVLLGYVERREDTLRWLVNSTETNRSACKKMILACTNHAHVTVHHEFGEYSAAYSSWRKKHRAKQCAEVGGWALGLVKEVDTIQRAVIAQIPAELKARMETAIIEKHGEEHKVEVEKELNKKLTVAQALELKPLFNFQGKLFSKQFFLSQAETLDVMFDVFGEGATAPQKDGFLLPKGATQAEVDEKAMLVAQRLGRRHFQLLIKPFEELDIDIPAGPHHYRHPFNDYELNVHPKINRDRIDMFAQNGSSWEGIVIEMNKQLAIVKGRVYWKSIFGTRRDDYTHEQLDKVQLCNKFANWTVRLEVTDVNGQPVTNQVTGLPLTKEINLFQEWLKSPYRLEYEHEIFNPKPVNNILPCQFNRWRGIAVPVASAKRHAASISKEELERRVQPFLDHLHTIICDGENPAYKYMLRWLASKYQFPWKKLTVNPVMVGDKGAGKGVFVQKFIELFQNVSSDRAEDHNRVGTSLPVAHITSMQNLVGTFNSLLDAKILVFVDEVGTENKREAQQLRALLTELTLSINAKYKAVCDQFNQFDVIFASNDAILDRTENERRFLNLAVSSKYAGTSNSETKKYFADILAVDPLDLGAYLTTVDLEGWNARAIPPTKGAQKAIEQSMDNWKQWLNDILQDGELTLRSAVEDISEDATTQGVFHEIPEDEFSEVIDLRKVCFIQKSLLYKHYRRWFQAKRCAGNKMNGQQLSNVEFWKQIKEFLPKTVQKRVGTKDPTTGLRRNIKTIPFSLANRDRFRDAIGHANWTFGDNGDNDEEM